METRIRNATVSEIPALLDLAKSVDRFISADEIRTWLKVDPTALFVAETSVGGKLVGSCCGTRLTPDLGFMGLYLVLEEYRGKGIGYKLWKAAKDHLGDRNIGVRGDPVNFRKYRDNEGFCHVEDYNIVYYECFGGSVSTDVGWPSDVEVATYVEGHLIHCQKKLSGNQKERKTHGSSRKIESDEEQFGDLNTSINTNIKNEADLSAFPSIDDHYCGGKIIETEHLNENFLPSCAVEDESTQSGSYGFPRAEIHMSLKPRQNHHEVQELLPEPVGNSKAEDILCGVVAFDESLHKRNRSFVVQQTFSWSSCRGKVALLRGKVVGYACLRNVITGHWIISPFYADTEVIAEILLFELLNEFDSTQAPKGIQVRFPDKNNSCKRLVEKFGFREKSTRISTGFTKCCMNVDVSKIYSFHSTVFCSE